MWKFAYVYGWQDRSDIINDSLHNMLCIKICPQAHYFDYHTHKFELVLPIWRRSVREDLELYNAARVLGHREESTEACDGHLLAAVVGIDVDRRTLAVGDTRRTRHTHVLIRLQIHQVDRANVLSVTAQGFVKSG